MLNDFQILASKYLFNEAIDLQERNFFNYTNVPALLQTFDIKPYLINLSALQFEFDGVDEDGNYFKPSEINLTFGGRINDKAIIDFFGVFDNQLFNKYIIEIKYNNTSIWKGIVNPESFKEVFKPSPDTEQLSISVYGFEKEFADYFKTIICDDLLGYGFLYDPDLKTYSYDLLSGFKNCFTRLGNPMFVTFNAESDISSFRINNNLALITNTGVTVDKIESLYYGYVFLKTSYKNVIDLKENKFDWFKKLLTSMGWVFYFEGNVLNVKNKKSVINTIYDITQSQILDWEFTKQFANSGYDYIVIEDSYDRPAGYYSNDYENGTLIGEKLHGQRDYIFSSTMKNFLETTPFRNYWIGSGGLIGGAYKYKMQVGQQINTIDETDGFIVNNARVTLVNSLNPDYFNYIGQRYSINPKRILKLNVGKAEGRYIQINKKRDEFEGFKFWNELIPNDIRLLYRITDVNYGNMLFRKVGTKYETYQDYVLGQQMSRNMRGYTNDKTVRRIKVRVRGLLFDNKLSTFQFSDIPDISGNYSVNSISFNLLEKSTTLELEQVI